MSQHGDGYCVWYYWYPVIDSFAVLFSLSALTARLYSDGSAEFGTGMCALSL